MKEGRAAPGGSTPSFARLFPKAVSHVTAGADATPEELYPQEEEGATRYTSGRRRDFELGRTCARQALKALGIAPRPIPVRPDRSPDWPADVVGAITHCEGLVAAAAAWGRDFIAIGLDAEPAGRTLGPGTAGRVCTAAELSAFPEHPSLLPAIRWPTIAFSAKEAVYKALGPIVGRRLGFHEIELDFDAEAARFAVRYVGSPDAGMPELESAFGRFAVTDDFVLTTIVLPRNADAGRESVPHGR